MSKGKISNPKLNALKAADPKAMLRRPGAVTPSDVAVDPAELNDPIPEDPDEFRWALSRKISTFLGEWRNCPRPVCRRAKACHSQNYRCLGAPEQPPMTEEQRADMMAEVRRLIEQRLAEDKSQPRLDPDQSRPGRRGR